MDVKISNKKHGIIGLCGHIGVGHSHSHSGFVQDDSCGLTVAASILKEALPIDSRILSVNADIKDSTLTIKTRDGGVGQTQVRRGITPAEAKLLEKIVGKDTIYNQRIVIEALGRIYGQGVLELPVALQGALALALVDTFKKKWTDQVYVVKEDIGENYGTILGTVIEIGKIPVSILLTINASPGGIGPIEDLEGNVMLGAKGDLMRQLNLDKIPTIVIESKSYVPNKAESLRENKFLIRANKDYDNIVVAKSLIEAAKDLELAYEYDFDTLDRGGEGFIQASKEFGEKISRLGNKFKEAHRAEEKVNILADLALLVSQDGAGLSFMSNKLQKDVGSAGMLKGTSAVISLLVTEEYIRNYKIPYITETDTKNYKVIIKKAIMLLHQNLEKAEKELREKFDFKPEAYSYLFK